MGKLSDYAKERIINLRRIKTTFVQIQKELSQDGINVTLVPIKLFWKKYEETGMRADRPRSGRPSVITFDMYNIIDSEMEKNDELTAARLCKIIHERTGKNVSRSAIKIARKKLGWVCFNTKYCQLIRENNREKRLKFCTDAIARNEQFEDCIFTDECTVELDRNAKISFRRKWEPPKHKPKAKHPYKVHIWAGINSKGVTPILIFNGIMDADFYVNTVLKDGLLPFVRKHMPGGHRFIQDNDPKHTSIKAKDFIKENNINWFPTPPESPDLNPIELIWHELKHNLRTYVKPKNAEELHGGILAFWKGLTADRLKKYVKHLQKVMPVIVKREGRASGY